MASATIQGHTYTDDGTNRNLNAGGHRTWFLPLVSDIVAEAADVATDAATASAAASTATTKASDASGYATTALGYRDTASTHATTATTKASEASGYATAALGYRDTASTHATTATTKASDASGYASAALGYRDTASTHATTATTKAAEAAASALTAVNAPGTAATSTTSLAIGTGSKSLTIQTGKALVVGMIVIIARTSAPSTTWMAGSVTAYTSGTGALVVDVTTTLGSGTYTDWTVSLTGPIGGSVSIASITGLQTALDGKAALSHTHATSDVTGLVAALAALSPIAGSSSIVTVGNVGTGAWQATAVAGQYGGTGVANTGKTITLGGNLTTSGAYACTFTLTNTTGVTLPTTGTLATLAGAESFTNKTLTNPTVTNYTETVYAPSAGSAFTVDLANGSLQNFTTNNNVTITLPAPAAGKSVLIAITYGGTHTVSWAVTGGSSIRWTNNTIPTATSANTKRDKYSFVCLDGTSWEGSDAGRNA